MSAARCRDLATQASAQSWALEVFLDFFTNKKDFFASVIMVI